MNVAADAEGAGLVEQLAEAMAPKKEAMAAARRRFKPAARKDAELAAEAEQRGGLRREQELAAQSRQAARVQGLLDNFMREVAAPTENCMRRRQI